ncbi:hypothetical protein F4804DRAFT_298613 [Jackrogersella minutella]|nr:hypothetical protein F4804DRAFT_298613 [Jackrogersella minutella]
MLSRRLIQPLWRSLPIRASSSATTSPTLRFIQRSRPFSQTHLRGNRWPPPPRESRNYNYTPRGHLSSAKPLVTNEQINRFFRSRGLHGVVVFSFLGALAFYFSNIETVPVSGRRRFNCFSDKSVATAGESQNKRLIAELEEGGVRFLSNWDPRVLLVKRVMKRLIPVSGMADADWEIRVIDAPDLANAFVLPGGKVFVFSGLIPIAGSEDGLAAVLGHEIAHNVAGHVAERMSSQIGVNIFIWSSILLSGGLLYVFFQDWIGRKFFEFVFSRPMGRMQESEADYIGLMMMAEACYDPHAALTFWARMNMVQLGEQPEWLSTHPSNDNRIQKIKEWLPKALEIREENNCQGHTVLVEAFKNALGTGKLTMR